MNGELNEALAFLDVPGQKVYLPVQEEEIGNRQQSEEYWRWRLHMAQQIGHRLDGNRFGVKGLYIFGSTKKRYCGSGQ